MSSRLRVLLAAGMLLGLVGVVKPASAATNYTCTFGPDAAGTQYSAKFTFTSLPGLGNDTLSITGKGFCSEDVPVTCPVGVICDIGHDALGATISASEAELPGENGLHFGKCDKDPFPPSTDYVLVNSTDLALRPIKVTFGFRGISVVRYLRVPQIISLGTFPGAPPQPPFFGPGTVFPSALTQRGVLFKDRDQEMVDGSVDFRTRLGGLCPEQGGNFRAYFDRVTFTVGN